MKNFTAPLAIVNYNADTIDLCRQLGYVITDNLQPKTLLVTNYAGVPGTVGTSFASDAHLHGRIKLCWNTQRADCEYLLKMHNTETLFEKIKAGIDQINTNDTPFCRKNKDNKILAVLAQYSGQQISAGVALRKIKEIFAN